MHLVWFVLSVSRCFKVLNFVVNLKDAWGLCAGCSILHAESWVCRWRLFSCPSCRNACGNAGDWVWFDLLKAHYFWFFTILTTVGNMAFDTAQLLHSRISQKHDEYGVQRDSLVFKKVKLFSRHKTYPSAFFSDMLRSSGFNMRFPVF